MCVEKEKKVEILRGRLDDFKCIFGKYKFFHLIPVIVCVKFKPRFVAQQKVFSRRVSLKPKTETKKNRSRSFHARKTRERKFSCKTTDLFAFCSSFYVYIGRCYGR